MSTCDVCGKRENMPYRCNHCGGTFCAQHRLPEAHDCSGLDNWGDPGGVFDSGFSDSGNDGGSDRRGLGRFLPDTGTGGIFGYFRGNVTYLMLGLMWITFLFQYLVYPYILNAPYGSPLWDATFVLQAEHPEYVWTWFTSIFSHGYGLGHIALNSIVIFFFGRIVEQYVGSRQFAILFIVSGALAGLGQIALVHVQALLEPATMVSGGVLGASGAGLAIMGVLTVLRPDLRVYLYFLIPVPIWAITAFYFVISIAGVLGGGGILGGNVADMAHLVGLLIGLAYGQRVKGRGRVPTQLEFGGGGPGGPGGPGRRRGPF